MTGFMERHRIAVHTVEVFLLVTCVLVSSVVVYGVAPYEAQGLILMGMVTDVMGLIIGLILFGALYMNRHPQLDEDRFMLLIVIVSILLALDILNWFVNGSVQYRYLNETLRYVKSILLLIFGMMFWLYFRDRFESDSEYGPVLTTVVFVISLLALFLLLSNLFTGLLFTLDAGAHYVRGRYMVLFYILVLCIIGVCMCSKVFFSHAARREKFVSVIYFSIWVAFTFVQFLNVGFSIVFVAPMLVIMIVYIHFYTMRCEELIQEQVNLRDESFSLMMSQLQPHFLYNSLTSILAIKGNPPETQDALFEFGAVLRNNLETLDSDEPIPFDQELERTESYLALEKLRFKDRLEIEMDIRDERFMVPPMTLQAIVENSVRHGITKRKEGGKVGITVVKEEGCHVIRVTDNGLGFDVGMEHDDGRPHVGFVMVRKRLHDRVNGTMEVESAPGLGTMVVMTIPDPVRCGNDSKMNDLITKKCYLD